MSRKMLVRYLLPVLVMAVYVVLVSACPAFAYGEKITNSLSSSIDWITKGVGGSLTVLGIIYVGIRMAMHDERALQKGLWVVGGGLIIFLSNSILELIKGLAGY